MKKKLIIISIFILLLILIISAFDTRLKIVEYSVESPKISNYIKIALITDLHSCKYGENQQELISAVDAQNPDIVLLGGDIFDDILPEENAKIFVSETAKKYPTYYVSGNHEWWSNGMYDFFEILTNQGVKILRGDFETLEIKGQTINICGIDDTEVDRYDTSFPNWKTQLKTASSVINTRDYSLLLAHHPELVNEYFEYDFDLALSGHAHGGQFRIPLILNGFYAPNQGFLPKYAGGRYDMDEKTLIISRGLSRENSKLPRIFNRPELVIITLK